ncbi:MAG: endolytic transglycosylase MltG [Pseudomonadota bacterium]|nr:endolytic transglycosylase MltG [Pseudomonadota bacterium]
MLAKLYALLLIILFLAVAAFGWLYYFANKELALPQSPFRFSLKAGSTMKTVARQLTDSNLLSEPWTFVSLARMLGKSTQIKAGEYELDHVVTPLALLRLLSRGQQAEQAPVQFIEGQTFFEMRKLLDQHPDLEHDSKDLSEAEILREVGASESKAEGMFFPDTYLVIPGSSDLKLLQRAYSAMQNQLASAWESRAEDLPYTDAYQALIMASIIEKETGQPDERPLIGSVFINRLKKGMLLQTDPTVIYGMGTQFNGNLRKADLQRDTPYNTYIRAGLPPTPIAMPGLAAIKAALNPAQSIALYFVAKGDGSHEFSSNLEDHNRAVNKYQR